MSIFKEKMELRQGDRILSLLQTQYPGYHPILGLAKIAHTTDDENLEFNAHRALARYVEPELKSVEVSVAPDSASELRVVFEGEAEEVPKDSATALEHKGEDEMLPVDKILAADTLELDLDVA